MQESRLARAATLLDAGAIAEVAAHEAGYANMSFFYKKFAERYGCTPAAYRQRLPR
ncbi:MAG: helix-turn-helix domain-containing protein [Collinsella aerofaciens]|nr:helix-turn-helix domain-containing protein [Collinsella aerofaciens]